MLDKKTKTTDPSEALRRKFSSVEIKFTYLGDGKNPVEETFDRIIPMDNIKKLKLHWKTQEEPKLGGGNGS